MKDPLQSLGTLLPTGGAWLDLSDRVLIDVRGTDARRFLNGRCTNDIRKLSTGESCPACVLTAKGKMCADVVITDLGHCFRLDAVAGLEEELPTRLERYLISDEAELSLLSGPDRPHLFHWISNGDELPPDFDSGHAVLTIPSFRFHRPGFDVWFSPGANLPPALSAEQAETLRILSGRPVWGKELDENSIPVEAGLESVAIRYDKGCYIGQEVISRIKSIGRVNRNLHLLYFANSIGDHTEIRGGEAASDRILGTITSTITLSPPHAPSETWALAYLKRSWETAEPLWAGDSTAEVHQLPFTQLPHSPSSLPLAATSAL